ncbi:MAG: hypothetical protein MZV63_18080 [Marinilabiliales bacterium]|nr:hypothetical protein [Marinilabiliales bacterium]
MGARDGIQSRPGARHGRRALQTHPGRRTAAHAHAVRDGRSAGPLRRDRGHRGFGPLRDGPGRPPDAGGRHRRRRRGPRQRRRADRQRALSPDAIAGTARPGRPRRTGPADPCAVCSTRNRRPRRTPRRVPAGQSSRGTSRARQPGRDARARGTAAETGGRRCQAGGERRADRRRESRDAAGAPAVRPRVLPRPGAAHVGGRSQPAGPSTARTASRPASPARCSRRAPARGCEGVSGQCAFSSATSLKVSGPILKAWREPGHVSPASELEFVQIEVAEAQRHLGSRGTCATKSLAGGGERVALAVEDRDGRLHGHAPGLQRVGLGRVVLVNQHADAGPRLEAARVTREARGLHVDGPEVGPHGVRQQACFRVAVDDHGETQHPVRRHHVRESTSSTRRSMPPPPTLRIHDPTPRIYSGVKVEGIPVTHRALLAARGFCPSWPPGPSRRAGDGQSGTPLTADDLLKATTASVLDMTDDGRSVASHHAPAPRQRHDGPPPLRGPRRTSLLVSGASVRRKHGNGDDRRPCCRSSRGIRRAAWSHGGTRLAFLQLQPGDAAGPVVRLRIWDADRNAVRDVALAGAGRIALNSSLELVRQTTLRLIVALRACDGPRGTRRRGRGSRRSTDGPIIVHSSKPIPFLEWDDLGRSARWRSLAGGGFPRPAGRGSSLAGAQGVARPPSPATGSFLTFQEDVTEKTDYDVIGGTDNALRMVQTAGGEPVTIAEAKDPKGVTLQLVGRRRHGRSARAEEGRSVRAARRRGAAAQPHAPASEEAEEQPGAGPMKGAAASKDATAPKASPRATWPARAGRAGGCWSRARRAGAWSDVATGRARAGCWR